MSNTPRRKAEQANAPARARIVQKSFIDRLAGWLNQRLDANERLSPSMLQKAIWVFVLVLIYIFIQHRFDGLIRKLETTETQLQEARASYISYKSKYLFASKQSELEKQLEPLGFEKNGKPPFKIAKKN